MSDADWGWFKEKNKYIYHNQLNAYCDTCFIIFLNVTLILIIYNRAEILLKCLFYVLIKLSNTKYYNDWSF